MNRQKSGFTLIELLTVIAIIGILAAILIPVVGRVRESARTASCASNVRQLGMAALMWENDHGHLPYGIFPGEFPASGPWWYRFKPYLDTPDDRKKESFSPVMECPSKTMPTPDIPVAVTYSANPHVMVDGLNSGASPVRSEAVWRATEVILFADSTQLANGESNTRMTSYVGTSYPALADVPIPVGEDSDGRTSRTAIRYRHNESANAVFVDGHVESMKKGTVLHRNLHINY